MEQRPYGKTSVLCATSVLDHFVLSFAEDRDNPVEWKRH